jgi:uncharacterized membrane protein
MRSITATVRRTATTVTFVLALTGLSRPAVAKEFTYTSLDFSSAFGINDSGQIVVLIGPSGPSGVLSEGVVTPLDDVPRSRPSTTFGFGINDGGDVVGRYVEAFPARPFPQGFLYRDGLYTRIRFEQAVEVFGINRDGFMVGRSCCRRGGNPEGFIIDPSGGVQFINWPDSLWGWASGINASGEIVGGFIIRTTSTLNRPLEALLYVDGTFNPSGETRGTSLAAEAASFPFGAYLYSDGVFMQIEVPGSSLTRVGGINDEGEIVGSYDDDTGTHGFFRDTDGTFTTLDFPGATGTGAGGINNDGDIVGGYTDATGNHAFLATPCESAHVRGKRLRRHRRTQ